jgi:hypothetical protein
MKVKLLLTIAILSAAVAWAQETDYSHKGSDQVFEKNKSYVTVGYGYPNFASLVFRNLVSAPAGATLNSSFFGPAYLKYERGIREKLGISFNLAYASGSVSYTEQAGFYTYREQGSYNTFSFNVKPTYHFYTNSNIDAYVGAGTGLRFIASEYSYSGGGSSDYSSDVAITMGFDATVGIRYMFTRNIGAYTELGFAKSLLQSGLTLKF